MTKDVKEAISLRLGREAVLAALSLCAWGATPALAADHPPPPFNAFEAHCAACHLQFIDENGAVRWDVIAADAHNIAIRLDWDATGAAAQMPPLGTEQRADLEQHPDVRQNMLAAVRAVDNPDQDLPLGSLIMPPGFHVAVFARVPGARSMTVSPGGTLFVGTADDADQFHNVYAMRDDDHDGRADQVFTIASGLSQPNGVAFKDGALYVAAISQILRLDGIESRLRDPPAPIPLPTTFPGDEHHGRKFIAFGPDGKLYVPVGAPCNACVPPPTEGALFRMNADGSGLETVATGIRNTVGFDWNPAGGELWFTDNGRDLLGDDEPPDELNRVQSLGLDFGFPRCNSRTPDPDFGGATGCQGVTTPAEPLKAHTAALGMRFYHGTNFPSDFRGNILIAEHGSWNSSQPVGYRLTKVTLANGAAISYQPFVTGWLKNDGSRWGRPVDIQIWTDDSLLVSDDFSGTIYRIWYAL